MPSPTFHTSSAERTEVIEMRQDRGIMSLTERQLLTSSIFQQARALKENERNKIPSKHSPSCHPTKAFLLSLPTEQ